MLALRTFLRQWPRLSAALAFGLPTTALTHIAWYVAAANTASSLGSFVGLVFFTGLFAFLAAGWALLLVSIGVAVGLYRLSDGG